MKSPRFPRSLAKELMSSLVSADARIERYELGEDPVGNTSAPLVRVRVHLPVGAVDTGIGFDLSLMNLALKAVDVVPPASAVRPANIKDKTWLCALFGMSGDSSIEVTFRFRPLHCGSPRLVLATSATLPSVLNGPPAGQLPTTASQGADFQFLPTVRAAETGGVTRIVHGVWIRRSEGSFFEAAEEVVLSPSFAAGLSAGEAERVGSLCQRMLGYFGHLFGCDTGGKVLVARPAESIRAESPAVPGAIFGTPVTFGVRETHIPKDIYLSRQVASLWFGAGVRITGQKSSALEFAICSAASLHWSSVFGDREDLERRLSQLRAFQSSARGPVWLQALRGRATAHVITRWTLAFYNAWKEDSEKAARIRILVQNQWGNAVSTDEVLSVLS